MRAYYSFVSTFYIPKFLWNGLNFMILLAWYETISVHSVFGTCLCNDRAQDWWVLEGNDGCNSKRTHWGKILGQVMPRVIMKTT